MTATQDAGSAASQLRCGIVLRVHEDACEVVAAEGRCSVSFVPSFPSPRAERLSPGHLVALLTTADGTEAVAWRWYDAVVLGEEGGLVRLWEPAHGEVLARSRTEHTREPGTRAYLSAGLPGADWWVAGPVVVRPGDAAVELDGVLGFCTAHGL